MFVGHSLSCISYPCYRGYIWEQPVKKLLSKYFYSTLWKNSVKLHQNTITNINQKQWKKKTSEIFSDGHRFGFYWKMWHMTMFLVLVCMSCAVHAEFSSAQLRGDELQKMHDESIKKTTSSSSWLQYCNLL